jgi:hypothetical protein
LRLYNSVTIKGAGEQTLGFGPTLKYTGTASPSIACGAPSCTYDGIKNLVIAYSDAGFTGVLVSNTGSRSGPFTLDGVTLTAFNSLTSASYLLDLTYSSNNHIMRSNFGGASKGINATGSNGSTFLNNVFSSIFGPITTTYIDNPGHATTIIGNDFEFIGEPDTGGPIVNCNSGCLGSIFAGNWVGDFPSEWNGSLFKGTHGMNISGNTFSGVNGGAGGTLFDNSTTGSTWGYTVSGNTTTGTWASVFSHNAAINGLYITGNLWGGTLAKFLSGTMPASGVVTDNSPATTIYGDLGGALKAANGSASAPFYTFSANSNQGLFSSNNVPEMSVGGFGILAWDTTGMRGRTNSVYGWSSGSGNPDRSPNDTGLSRDSAGVVDCGNGKAADTTCKLQAAGYISKGTTFTAFGCTNSAVKGGATAGSFKVGQSTNCSVTITMGNSATAPNGWTCTAYDETTAPAQAIRQTGHSATTCVLNMTVAMNDIITFSAVGW